MPGNAGGMAGDRQRLPVLVVFPKTNSVGQLKSVLSSLGFAKIVVAQSHVLGLERLRERSFPLVIFDAVDSDMPAVEFANAALSLDPEVVVVPVSKNPRVDDVFGMLKVGARGFIVDPFTTDTVEKSLERAHDGPPLSSAILEARDRNAALVSMVLHALYRLCILEHMTRRYPKAEKDRKEQHETFCEAMELALLFCDGGLDTLREAIVDGCIKRANVAATRLGRTRRKLRSQRTGGSSDTPQAG